MRFGEFSRFSLSIRRPGEGVGHGRPGPDFCYRHRAASGDLCFTALWWEAFWVWGEGWGGAEGTCVRGSEGEGHGWNEGRGEGVMAAGGWGVTPGRRLWWGSTVLG